MKMPIPGAGAFEYDSKSDTPPTGIAAMIAPMYKAMTEGEFEITITSRGEFKDVKVPEEVLAALKNSPAAAMGDMATPEGFKKMISQGALVLPEKSPQPGDEWTTTFEMNNPQGGKQIIETTYRFEGMKEVDGTRFAVFQPKLNMKFEGAGPAKIKDQESTGEILFNPEAGRLHSSKLNQTMTIEQPPVPSTKLDQTIEVKVTSGEATESGDGGETNVE
jgi:hypothetical protein